MENGAEAFMPIVVTRTRFDWLGGPPKLVRRRAWLAWPVIFVVLPLSATASAQLEHAEVGYRASVIYAEGERQEWRLQESFAEAQFSTRRFGLNWDLRLSHIVPTGDLRFGYLGSPESAPVVTNDPNGGRLSGRIRFQRKRTAGRLTVRPVAGFFSTAVELLVKEDHKSEMRGAFLLRPSRFMSVGVSRRRFQPLPSSVELYFTPYSDDSPMPQQGGDLFWQTQAQSDDITLNVMPSDRTRISVRSGVANLVHDRPKYGDAPMGTYTAHYYGEWSELQIKAGQALKSGLTSSLDLLWIDLKMDSLVALDGGLKFAHFYRVEAHGFCGKYDLKYFDWHASISAGSAEGEISGVVQAWPFLEGLYHFLGERRHVVVGGQLSWVRASTASRLFRSGPFRLDGEVDYMRIKPDITYNTWRLAVLGMGKDDEREGDLGFSRADLIRLRLSPCFTHGPWRLLVDVSQWVPLSTAKTEAGSETTPTSGGGDSVWGGFFLFAALGANF